MAEILQAATRAGVFGTITLDGGRLSASSPALQDIIDSWLKRKGGAQAAFTAMDGWSNGYLAFGRPEAAAAHTASLARAYERTEHGRPEHVRGYVTRRPKGWIPEPKWLEGQREWVARGEAAWKDRDALLTGDEVHAAAGTPDLDNAEQQALWLYTADTNYSSAINGGLQQGEDPGAEVRGLDSAIAKASPLPRPAVVYRGGHWADALKPGDVIEEKGFTSTTTRETRAESVFAGFPAEHRVQLAQITIPAGMRVLSAANQGVSQGERAGEAEVILPRGTRFRVAGFGMATLPAGGTRTVSEQVRMIQLEALLPVHPAALKAEGPAGSQLAVRKAGERPAPSPGSLAAARQMVQHEGTTPAQHEAIAQELASNLDRVPVRMREAMTRTWKVRVLPQEEVGPDDPGILGSTFAWHGSWEIRIAQNVMTPEIDRKVTEMEADGSFIKVPGGEAGAALRHVVTHEFGHALWDQAEITAWHMVEMDGPGSAMGETVEGQQDDADVLAVILKDLSGGQHTFRPPSEAQMKKILGALSGYGSTSPDEAIAEVWTAFMLDGLGADGSMTARRAGRDLLRAARQVFDGENVQLTARAGAVPYRGCSGFPASREDYDRRFGTPEARRAAARAWGLPAGTEVRLAQVRRYVRTEHGRRETVRSYVTRSTARPDEHGWIPPADWLKGQRIWVARGEAIWAANKWKQQARTFHAHPDDAVLRPAATLQPGDHILLPHPAGGHQESVVKALRRTPQGMRVEHVPAGAWPAGAEPAGGMSWESGRMRLADLPEPVRRSLAARDYTQDEMAESIRQHGVEKPVAIFHFSPNEVAIGNGWHRVEAAIAAGLADVPVIVQHGGGTKPGSLILRDRKPATYADWREAIDRPAATTVTVLEPSAGVPVLTGSRLAGGVSPGGFSIDMTSGEPPRTGFMVAQTGHTHTYPADILQDRQRLAQAIDQVIMAGDIPPGAYLGGWVSDGKLWIEPSDNVANKASAVRLGKRRNQVSIWDVENGAEISTGGTGGGRITEHGLSGEVIGVYSEGDSRQGSGELQGPAGGGAEGGRAAAGRQPAQGLDQEIAPLPQGTPTARPVLYPDQRRMLEAAVNNVRHPGTTAEALDRIAGNQPLSVEQLMALSISTRLEARSAATARGRALNRIADQLDAARAEIAASQGIDNGQALRDLQAKLTGKGTAVKTTAGDLATGDVISWRDFDGSMATGTVTAISTQRHGRLVEATVRDSAGDAGDHLFSARTVIYRLPDLPPDKPLPPPDVPAGATGREYVTVENLRPGDILESIWGGGPATVTGITRTGFSSASVKLLRAEGGTWATDVGGNPAGIAGIRIHRGPASADQPYDMAVPAETPVPVQPDQVQPGDMVHIATQHFGRRGAVDVTGTVTSVEPVTGENGQPGARLSVLEQAPRWNVTTYSIYRGDQAAQGITRLVPAASNPLARFADQTATRRDAIASSLWFTFGRIYKQLVDGIASVALTATLAGYGPPDYAGSADRAAEAIRGMTIEPLLVRVAYLRSSAASQMVPGGLDGRQDLIDEAAAALKPLIGQIAEMAQQQALATLANVPDTGTSDDVVTAIEALQADPPLPNAAVRALASAAQQMAESVTAAPGPKGGQPDVPQVPRWGGSVAEMIAPYRAAMPANPANVGMGYVNRSLFEPPTLEGLQRGIVPAMRTARVWVADKAADGGPGLIAMAQNEIIRKAGTILQLEVARRTAAAVAGLEDQRVSLEATVVSLGAEAGRRFDAAYKAGAEARVAVAVQHGFRSWDALVREVDARERSGKRIDDLGLADANDVYEKAYAHVIGDVLKKKLAAQKKLDAVIAQQAAAGRAAVISVLSEARGEPFGGVPLTYTAARGGGAQKAVLVKDLRWAEGNYPASWLQAAKVHAASDWMGYRVAPQARGDYSDSQRLIHLSTSPELVPGSGEHGRVATHEMGHIMEAAVPGLSALENAELWRRTAAGPIGSRRQEPLLLMDGYLNEYGRADRFPLVYSGKEYTPDDTAHELFTTGIESLLAGSSYLDPEFEKWMLGVLALAGPTPEHPYTGAGETQARAAEAGTVGDVASAPAARKSVTMVTAGGYKVTTVSTVDRGQWFSVSAPSGVSVPLDPWNPHSSPEIRTLDQLKEVLEREGQDYSTLRELPSGDRLAVKPGPLGAKVGFREAMQLDAAVRQHGLTMMRKAKIVGGVQVAPAVLPVFAPVLAQLSPRAMALLYGALLVWPAPNQTLGADVVGGEYHSDKGSIDFNPAAFTNPQYAAMHEVGHALDHRLDWRSQQQDFATLIMHLVQSGEVTVTDYLLPSHFGGDAVRARTELWAEFFAWYMMGNGGTTSQVTHVSAAAAAQLSAYFARFGLKGTAAKRFASEIAALAASREVLPVCVLVTGPDGQVRALTAAEIRQLQPTVRHDN